MNWRDMVGKKVKSKCTGEIRKVLGYASGPGVTLADEQGNREDWVGFQVGSPASEEWEEYGDEIKIQTKQRSFSERIAYLLERYHDGVLDEEFLRLQIKAALEY